MKKESALQIEIVDFLSRHAQKHKFVYFFVPNEGTFASGKCPRSGGHDCPARGATITNLKKMGLTPGASDLCIIKKGRAHFMEVKSATGKLSKQQLVFGARIRDCWGKWVMVRSLEDAKIALETWGII